LPSRVTGSYSSNVLNIAWLLAGGVGLPLEDRQIRLWSTAGFLYVMRMERESLSLARDMQVSVPSTTASLEIKVRDACRRYLLID
jgi:hypothetical protein